MNINDACKILQISHNELTHILIKHQYYKLSLIHHPDKNNTVSNSDDKFIEIKQAYDYLTEHLNYNSLHNSQSNSIHPDIYICTYFLEIIFYFLNDKLNLSTKLIRFIATLQHTELNKLKIILKPISTLLPDDIYQLFYGFNSSNLFIYTPSLHDIIHHNILVKYINQQTYYIPSWHHEIIFDNLHIFCIPNLPDNITIDNDNNIHIFLSYNIHTLITTNNLYFYIDDIEYCIKHNKIFIKKNQIIILHNKGIPIISNTDIYSNKFLSNIILHLNLY
jgi:hypothetical protein